MLLTIEKVAILSGVPIFPDIPEYVLASVAEIVEEIELDRLTIFFSGIVTLRCRTSIHRENGFAL